jgi:hypothetical protein
VVGDVVYTLVELDSGDWVSVFWWPEASGEDCEAEERAYGSFAEAMVEALYFDCPEASVAWAEVGRGFATWGNWAARLLGGAPGDYA